MFKVTRLFFLTVILVVFFISFGNAQYPDWQAITGMNGVKDVATFGQTLWAVSDGGAFSYNIETGQITRYTTVDGLRSVNLLSVAIDNRNNVLTGSDDGYIQVFNLSSESWKIVYDFDGRSINNLFISGDTLWVATEKGIAHFYWRDGAYQFNVLFQNFPQQIDKIRQLNVFNKRIWAATPQGLLSAPSDVFKYTLNDPARWELKTSANGLPSMDVNSITRDSVRLWIATSKGLAFLDKVGQTTVVPDFSRNAISKLFWQSPFLYAALGRSVWKYLPEDKIQKKIVFDQTVTALSYANDIWVGINRKGLKSFDGQHPIKVNGPPFSNLRYVWVDDEQRIWLSSGKYKLHSPVEGFYVFDGSEWTQYKFSGDIWARLSATVTLYEDKNKNMWIGSWGGGLIVYNHQTATFEFLHTNETPGTLNISTSDSSRSQDISLMDGYKNHFSGANIGVADYEVITAIREDADGNLWFVNSYAMNGNYLAVAPAKDGFVDLDPSNWTYFGKADGIILSEGGIPDLAFDDFGRAWIATQNQGVYILDYNRTLNNRSDDALFKRTVDDNLAGNEVRSLANDKEGVMWIGTTSGLSSYDGLNFYRHPGDGENGVNGPVGIQINQIRVDNSNNKWVATTAGLSILRSNKNVFEPGAWESFTTANSGLLNDDVHSIFINQAYGKAYLATEGGLSIYTGSFAEIRDDFNSVVAGPNPFVLDGTNEMFQIRHLKNNSTVQVYTVFGKLIRVLTTSNNDIDGGRAYWDGKDKNGFPVASGIYLYLAFTDDGASTSGKVAVIRK